MFINGVDLSDHLKQCYSLGIKPTSIKTELGCGNEAIADNFQISEKQIHFSGIGQTLHDSQ